MNTRLTLAVLLSLVCLNTATAAIVGVDYAVAVNGTVPVFGDLFDDDTLSPSWVTNGSPGPEAGGFLVMKGGDLILAPVVVDPMADTTAIAQLKLADFPAGSAVSLLMFGGVNEVLALSLIPDTGFMVNGATTLAAVPVPLSSDVTLSITKTANNVVIGTINGVQVYSDTLTFGAPTAIGISVVPEPVTAGLLLVGLAAGARCRRRA